MNTPRSTREQGGAALVCALAGRIQTFESSSAQASVPIFATREGD